MQVQSINNSQNRQSFKAILSNSSGVEGNFLRTIVREIAPWGTDLDSVVLTNVGARKKCPHFAVFKHGVLDEYGAQKVVFQTSNLSPKKPNFGDNALDLFNFWKGSIKKALESK